MSRHTNIDDSLMHWASFGVAWFLFLIAIWGLIAFFPRRSDRGNSAPAWLILAIWLGFLSDALNVLYWRVFGDLALHYAWLTQEQLRYFGAGIGDIIWKGLGAIAVYMHFFARWKTISPEEQRHWRPLMMGFYPNAKHWAVRMLTFWKTNKRDEFYSRAEQEAQDRET